MATGYLALILHAHLPFVRHPEHDEFLEEDWFFEAITESYIPLLEMMRAARPRRSAVQADHDGHADALRDAAGPTACASVTFATWIG